MKRIFLILLVVCACVTLAIQKLAAQSQPVIAVYVVTNDADTPETKAIKQVLEAKLAEAIVKSGLFIGVERSEAFLAQLLKEQEYQLSGNVRDDQIAMLAMQSGAKYLCVADIYEVFGKKFVTAKLIDAESYNIIASTNSTGNIKNLNGTVSIAEEVSQKLIKETPAAKAVEQQAAQTAQALEEERLRDAQAAREQLVGKASVVIAGIEWATRNVNGKKEFTVNPQDVGQSYPLKKAVKSCPEGWRLPSEKEYKSLINSGVASARWDDVEGVEYGSGQNVLFVPITASGYYWSDEATTGKGKARKGMAMEIRHTGNSIRYGTGKRPATEAYNLRCVRAQ
jgi:hypothetical protein